MNYDGNDSDRYGDGDADGSEDEDFVDTTIPSLQNSNSSDQHMRTIVHLDIDCFYAQVEMLLNPALAHQPIGVQQKFLVVTTNYVARDLGVKKMTWVKDALQQCPSLILLNGEDISKYRFMSERIYQCLTTFSPLVEKLGLDENFLDITEQVNRQLAVTTATPVLVGHVYGQDESSKSTTSVLVNKRCNCGCAERLAIGSRIAQEMRNRLKEELGITSCAGIATNKLLAKLAGSTYKPNQQTTVFPWSSLELISSLKIPRAIPGIGHSTAKKLETLGITTIEELQKATIPMLSSSLGGKWAKQVHLLSYGVDLAKVNPLDRPKSIGAEDGFPIVRTHGDVREKMKTLLTRVTLLIQRDGRRPTIIKLTVRQVFHYDNNAAPKRNVWETKQTSLDVNIDATESVLKILMILFEKMVGVETTITSSSSSSSAVAAATSTTTNTSGSTNTWKVTGLNISFSGFLEGVDEKKSTAAAAVTVRNYFKKREPSVEDDDAVVVSGKRTRMEETGRNVGDTSCSNRSNNSSISSRNNNSSSSSSCSSSSSSCSSSISGSHVSNERSVVIVVDDNSNSNTCTSTSSNSSSSSCETSDQRPPPCCCPHGFDASVFNQLPLDIQKELTNNNALLSQTTTSTTTTTKMSLLSRTTTRKTTNKKPVHRTMDHFFQKLS